MVVQYLTFQNKLLLPVSLPSKTNRGVTCNGTCCKNHLRGSADRYVGTGDYINRDARTIPINHANHHQIHSLRTILPSGHWGNVYWCMTSGFTQLVPRCARRPALSTPRPASLLAPSSDCLPALPPLGSPWYPALTHGGMFSMESAPKSGCGSTEVCCGVLRELLPPRGM
jgi:hypothetical protein